MNLQNWIHKITEGSTATLIRFVGIALGFVGLAVLYNIHNQQSIPPQEAMDTAQVARNLAEGKGYTTLSIRPLALALLHQHSPKSVASLPEKQMPEVSNPPVYPALLATFLRPSPIG